MCPETNTTDPVDCAEGLTSRKGAGSCHSPPVGPVEVIPCPVGYYGLDPECNPCPANTNSSLGNTSTILDCRCLAGFVCTYTKRISVVLTLHNITWDMRTPAGLSQSSIIDAIALAAGVSRSNVVINPMFSGRRRLMALNSGRHVMFITVKEADGLDVQRVYSELSVSSHVSWAHSHSVHVARLD
jgi:hypothetical protein